MPLETYQDSPEASRETIVRTYGSAIEAALDRYASSSERWIAGRDAFIDALVLNSDVQTAIEAALSVAGEDHEGTIEAAHARFWNVVGEEANDTSEIMRYDAAIDAALDHYAVNGGLWTHGKDVFNQALERGLSVDDALEAALDAAQSDHEGTREDAVMRFRGLAPVESPAIMRPEIEDTTALYSPTRSRRIGSAKAGILMLHDTIQDSPDVNETLLDLPPRRVGAIDPDATVFDALQEPDFERLRGFDSDIRQMTGKEIRNKFDSLEPSRTPRDALLEHSEFQPKDGIHIDGKNFVFSDLFNTERHAGYTFAMMYEYDEARTDVKPRLCYKSKSDGGWRISPGFLGNRMSKGEFGDTPNYGQYVQATRPDENIAAFLESKQSRGSDHEHLPFIQTDTEQMDAFLHGANYAAALQSGFNTYEEEVTLKLVKGHGITSYVSGYGFKPNRADALRAIERMELPDGFEPDFELNPIQVYTMEHTLAGRTVVEVYTATLEEREIEWHVARDAEGRIWIDRIEFSDGELTTYGTRAEVILAGALSSKPFDYNGQLHGLSFEEPDPDAAPFSFDYADITPLLKKLPSIRRYQEAKGLIPHAA